MAEELEEYKPWTWKAPEGGYIGRRRLGRRDGYDKASGKGLFVHDIIRPGMLYAKVLHSPYPNAKILNMDTSKAEALPGVWKVLRYDDTNINWPNDGGSAYVGPMKIVSDSARFYYKPIGAMVVAESELICDEALRLIDIEWDVKPFTLFWNDAAAPGAPVLFPELKADSNLKTQVKRDYLGDVEAGMKEAKNIITTTWHVDVDAVAGVEGGVCVAEYLPPDGVRLWPHIQHWAPLGMSAGGALRGAFPWIKGSKMWTNTHLFYNGGLFGQLIPWENDPPKYAIIAAKETGRPVKFIDDNHHFLQSGEEAGNYTLEIGFQDDGSVVAVKGHTEQNYQFMSHMENVVEGTKIPNVQNTASYYYDNHGGYSCYKDRGALTNIVGEIFEQVAAALNMDPTEVALINDGSEGKDMAWINANVKAQQGFDASRDSLKEVLAIGKQAIDWDNKWHQPGTKILPNGNYHGIGFRWTNTWTHTPRTTCLGIRMQNDGTVNLLGQKNDIGVNHETTYCQVAADELGIPYENVFMQWVDYTGFDTVEPGGSSAMSGTIPAVARAARKLKRVLLEKCMLQRPGGWFSPPQPPLFEGKTPDELDIKDGMVYEKANPDNKQPVSILASAFGGSQNTLFAWDANPSVTEEMYVMGRQVYFMEVEVDPDTGMVHIKKLVVVNDAGKLINPEQFEGQQYGGSYMGIGRSNQEEVIWDPIEGVKLTDDLINYPIALMNDCEAIECYQIETGLNYCAYGESGIGESGGANVCNLTRYAVFNAIGKWVDLKTKPDKILKALGKV